METVSLSEAKDRLSALVDAVEKLHEVVTITRRGRPAAVLVSVDELEALRETVSWLADPTHHEEAREALENRAARVELSVEEARAILDQNR